MDGGDGNDVLNGSGGGDVMIGGNGVDTVSYHWSGAGVDVDLTRSTQVNGDASGDTLRTVENLTGSANADKLRGDAGANVLKGLAGSDVLEGRGGADVLTGGTGTDRFVFGSATDANGDRITDWEAGDILDLSGMDANLLIAGQQSFTLIGAQAFSKMAGQLRFYNNGTDSFLAGDVNGDGTADFTIMLNGVHASIPGVSPTAIATAPAIAPAPTSSTISSPTRLGSSGADTLNGSSALDRIDAREGDDVLNGSGGADVLAGGAGVDTVSYHWSGGAVNVDLNRATQYGGDAHADTLIGIERIAGSAHNDMLSGDAHANALIGNGGNDVLNGRGGADLLTGGSGNDRFIFDSAANARGDRVADWRSGDVLDFSQIDANELVAGNQGFTNVGAGAFTKVAGQLRVYTDGTNSFIAGDVNGDGVADFTVAVTGMHDLTGLVQ
jgi:Ca2+-binding RTX toxin-like protein